MNIALRLRPRGAWIALVLVSRMLATPVHAQAVRMDFCATNGAVRSSALAGDVLYLGGDFTWVGYATGACGLLDRTTGATDWSFPRVSSNEQVRTVVPDGSGGWFVGGSFTSIGGMPRQNLAHVLADNTVAPWTPDPNGEVHALLLRGATLIVGGSFSSIGGATRGNLAAVSVSGAGSATTWDPGLDGSADALAGTATAIFVGGSFSRVGPDSHFYIASIDPASGLAASGWSPQVFGSISSLAVADTTLYVGGTFSAISGAQVVSNLAAIGTPSGAIHAWAPTPDGSVNGLSATAGGAVLYVAGDFLNIGTLPRRGLAALDAATGNAVAVWNANADSSASCVLWAGSTIYAGGAFSSLGPSARIHLAALDSLTGKAQAWAPNADAPVTALAATATKLLAGGGPGLASVGGVPRNRAAALDARTGRWTAWDPNVDGTVEALVVQGTNVFLGGSFAKVGNQSRPFAAAVDRRQGVLRAGWQPAAGAIVHAMADGGAVTYVGGEFTSIGGQTRHYVAALDTTTGLANGWDPNAGPLGSAVVTALAASGSTVYVGGVFASIGGAAHVSLAAIGSNGLATGFAADVFGFVSALAVAGGNLVVGGNFSSIGSSMRANLGEVAASSGAVAGWNPAPTGPVLALAVAGDTVYAGGFFTNIGGATRPSIAALNPAGTATPWSVGTNGAVYALAATRANVYLAGDFMTAGSVAQPNVAAAGAGTASTGVDDGPPPAGPAPLLATRPNPFAGATRLRFTLPTEDRVTLEVLDLSGRLVATLVDGRVLAAGTHEVEFRGVGLRPGVYLGRLLAGGRRSTWKLVHTE